MSVPIPVGTWLVYDPDEDVSRGLDYSVWQRTSWQTFLLVDWFGTAHHGKTADYMMPERFIWVHLTDEHLAQLTVAAEHGCFRRVAEPLWDRIMA